MRTFLFKLIIFAAFPIASYFLSFASLKAVYAHKISGHSIIILGDSHTQHLHLPNTLNRSIDGSPYFVHFGFVKAFEKTIRNKRIYLACNYHNLSNLYESRLKNDSLFPGWKQVNLARINDYNLIPHMFPGIEKGTRYSEWLNLKKLFRLFKEDVRTPILHNSADRVADTASIYEDIYRHWRHPKYVETDYVQQNYLDKLVRLLLKNHNEVIILKMPVTSYYFDNVPEKIKAKISRIPDEYPLRLLDLHTQLNISSNYSLFKDYAHLNIYGDSIVNQYFLENELEGPSRFFPTPGAQ